MMAQHFYLNFQLIKTSILEVESGEYSLVNPDLINLDTGEINGMKEDSNIDFFILCQ